MRVTANGPKDQTDWQCVDWRTANRQVRNLRQRIFRASRQGDWKRVHSLQKLMLRSNSNRLLAVRRVTQTNAGRRTPGVDRVVVKTPAARGQLVDELRSYQPWRAKPVKRVYIPKANGAQRSLGIPVVRDRALQAMIKNALEPSWEARFEATSYGFRPGRGCHDAMEMVYIVATPHRQRKWVLDADIKGAFDHIDHRFLLATIGPVPGRELIKQWLKAGYLDREVFHPTTEGTPQGGVISPLLLNIALHGMEDALGIRWSTGAKGERRNRTPRALVRYADDVRHITRCQIPFTERRGTEELTSGSTANLMAKAKGNSSMPVKRERTEDVYGLVLQDPRDTVKAKLPEPQSPAMQAYILRLPRLKRSHHDRATKSSSPEASAWWAVRNDRTQGDGRGTYIVLETSDIEGIWDRPTRREAQGDGAAVVLSGRESRLHGEGRQVL